MIVTGSPVRSTSCSTALSRFLASVLVIVFTDPIIALFPLARLALIYGAMSRPIAMFGARQPATPDGSLRTRRPVPQRLARKIILYLGTGMNQAWSMQIHPGTPVLVTMAGGGEQPRIAVTDIVPGRDMPVVWVTTEDQWCQQGLRASRFPWPAQFVRPSQATHSPS